MLYLNFSSLYSLSNLHLMTSVDNYENLYLKACDT